MTLRFALVRLQRPLIVYASYNLIACDVTLDMPGVLAGIRLPTKVRCLFGMSGKHNSLGFSLPTALDYYDEKHFALQKQTCQSTAKEHQAQAKHPVTLQLWDEQARDHTAQEAWLFPVAILAAVSTNSAPVTVGRYFACMKPVAHCCHCQPLILQV